MRILLVFAIFTMMSISAVLPARKQEDRPLSSDAFTNALKMSLFGARRSCELFYC